MQSLFENAVQSIQLGVEDYQANEPARALSAVRNFYAGLLLLAKEVLVRRAPKTDANEIIAARYKPIPDDSGGVKYVAASKQTIDLETIGKRFKDFGLPIDQKALWELGNIRNAIEHRYSEEQPDSILHALAKAFPVAVALFRLADEEPYKVLGNAWEAMLKVHTVYEREKNECLSTFEKVEWLSPVLKNAPRTCPECWSDLVAQDTPHNGDQDAIEACCRSCGASFDAEALIERTIGEYLWVEGQIAAKDGGDDPLQDCPECSLSTYVFNEEAVGCVWCGFTLDGECARCHTSLMPDDIDPDNHGLCGYCGSLWAKDD